MYAKHLMISLAFLFLGCSSIKEPEKKRTCLRQPKGEYIYRKHDEFFFQIPLPEKSAATTYPWNISQTSPYPVITKEHFRCKGNILNPKLTLTQNGDTRCHYDCNGIEKHSLPLRNGKEFIFPIFIDLLNYIQDSTQKKVIITSGHRCPDHNTYVDQATSNQYSKHMIGAEISFYVEGMEFQPEKIVALIQEFYTKNIEYKDRKEYTTFQRWEKGTSNVSTLPWYNKEIFIKLFLKNEGRNFDNRHSYPYLSLQARHDRDLNEPVTYSWDKAFRNFYRK